MVTALIAGSLVAATASCVFPFFPENRTSTGPRLESRRQDHAAGRRDFTQVLLGEAQRNCIPVGFLGSTPLVLSKLLAAVRRKWPGLQIAYECAPPFRPLTTAEDESMVFEINSSGARLLFVGLGCPKQELWMAAHKGKVNAVMLGVGAAFDFLAGAKPQAPRWMMGVGLEWLFRLATEPRRLWKRYLKQNPRFIVLFALQLLGVKFRRAKAVQRGA